MPLDPDIPFKALTGMQRAQTYDPLDVQEQINRNQVLQGAAQKAQRDAQSQQRLQQLAQQYGDDPDELVKQLGSVDPMLAQKLGEQIGQARFAGAQAHLEQTKSAAAEIDSWQRLLQSTDDKTWSAVRNAAVAKMPQLGSVLPAEYSDQAKQQALALGMSAKDWAKTQADASQLYLDGKTQLSAARLISGSDSPQKRQIAEGLLKQAGLGQFSQMWASPQEAQAFIDAQAKDQPDKVQGLEQEALKAQARKLNKPVDQLTPEEVEAVHRNYKQAGTIVRVTGGGGAAGPGDLTPEGIEYAATQYRLTGKMPPLGMGKTPARGQIINKAAEQARMIGQTPVAAIQRQAAFSADSKSLTKMQTMSDAASAYEQKALAQLDIIDGLSDKVSRTSIPLLNRAILSGQTEIAGDANATMLLNAITTGTTEYAKIMAGGTGSAQASTDSARRESSTLLSAAMSPATLRKQTALMRKEMQLTMDGYGATIDHINSRMGGAPQQPTPEAGTVQRKPIPGIPGGIAELRNGRWIRVQ